ncbi:MAG TPA: hypothetical protein DCE42_18775 [Myxococcales bacterium]|nr:hypothetical protein [Deltaproteobacteria bacterium]MBK07358.1 hypothetical protein [Deltaproteobacteria bacterium]MBU53517.1 hypothetical protein [Deltaproteobacteria bacterium]HAA56818.1 hypothetical protein [Myxococcales bacterium]
MQTCKKINERSLKNENTLLPIMQDAFMKKQAPWEQDDICDFYDSHKSRLEYYVCKKLTGLAGREVAISGLSVEDFLGEAVVRIIEQLDAGAFYDCQYKLSTIFSRTIDYVIFGHLERVPTHQYFEEHSDENGGVYERPDMAEVIAALCHGYQLKKTFEDKGDPYLLKVLEFTSKNGTKKPQVVASELEIPVAVVKNLLRRLDRAEKSRRSPNEEK